MLAEVEFVVHALLFGFEVAFVVLVGGDDDRYDLVDLQAVTLQPYSFERIVGHQTHVFDPHFADDAGAHAVVALIDAEAQAHVGIHRVQSFVLSL